MLTEVEQNGRFLSLPEIDESTFVHGELGTSWSTKELNDSEILKVLNNRNVHNLHFSDYRSANFVVKNYWDNISSYHKLLDNIVHVSVVNKVGRGSNNARKIKSLIKLIKLSLKNLKSLTVIFDGGSPFDLDFFDIWKNTSVQLTLRTSRNEYNSNFIISDSKFMLNFKDSLKESCYYEADLAQFKCRGSYDIAQSKKYLLWKDFGSIEFTNLRESKKMDKKFEAFSKFYDKIRPQKGINKRSIWFLINGIKLFQIFYPMMYMIFIKEEI